MWRVLQQPLGTHPGTLRGVSGALGLLPPWVGGPCACAPGDRRATQTLCSSAGLPGVGVHCLSGVSPWQLPACFWGFRENLGEEALARGGERHECVQGKE